THRLGVAPRRHRDPVFIGTHVDAGGVGIGHGQGPPPRPRCGVWEVVSAWRHGSLQAPWHRMLTRAAGAGATGPEAVSQAGSRRSVSPVLWSLTPGTILTDGHEAPRSRPIFRTPVALARWKRPRRQPEGWCGSLRDRIWAGVGRPRCKRIWRWRLVRRVACTTRPRGRCWISRP